MKVPLGVWTPRAAPSPLPRPARNSCALSRNRRESLTAMSRWPISLARDAPRPRSGSTGRRPRDGHGGHASLDIAGAVGRCRNPQRARQCRRSRRRPRARARWHALGSDLRRRRQPRRHGRGRPRHRTCQPARALPAAHRPQGPGRRLHRGHARLIRARRRRHGRRPAARRGAAAAHAGGGPDGRRSRHRHALRRGRIGGDGPLAGASVGQPGRQSDRSGLLGDAAQRSHERLLHDPARCLRSAGARAFHAGLQAAARYRRLAEAAACDRRAALPLPGAPAWRLQARRHRGDGPSRPAAGQAFGRPAAGAVRAVCGRGSHGPARASRRAQGAARHDADRLRRGTGARGLCGHDLELRAQQPAHLSRSPAQGLERASGDCSHSTSCAASARSPTSGWRAGCTAAARAGGWPAPRAR